METLEQLLNDIEDRIRAGDTVLKREINEALVRAKGRKGTIEKIIIRDVSETIAEINRRDDLRINPRVLKALEDDGYRGEPYLVTIKYIQHLRPEKATLRDNLNALHLQSASECNLHLFVEAVIQHPEWVPKEPIGSCLSAAMEPMQFGKIKTFAAASWRGKQIRISAKDKRKYESLDPKFFIGWVMSYGG